MEKQDLLPRAWAEKKYAAQVDAYLLSQDLKELPEQISDFLDFYEWRRLRLRATLAARLGVAT